MQTEIIDQIANKFKSEFKFKDKTQDKLDEYEFEAILEPPSKDDEKRKIHYEEFVNIFKYLKSNYTVLSQPEVLDIAGSGQTRISIHGLNAIKKFMDTREIPSKSGENVTIIKKTLVSHEDQIGEYGIRFNLKSEKKIEHITVANFKENKYRYKKRFSFIDSLKKLRYDITIVKEKRKKDKDLINLSSAFEHYEVEIEYIGNIIEFDKDILNGIVLAMNDLILVAWNLPAYVYSKDILGQQMKFYLDRIKYPKDKDNEKWIGPSVVSFSQKYLGYFIRKYYITPKADGIRSMLFIGKDLRVYMIKDIMNNPDSCIYSYIMPTRFVAETKKLAGAILDGELVTKDLNSNSKWWFYVFDCYVGSKKPSKKEVEDIREQPLSYRLDAVDAILKYLKLDDDSKDEVDCKIIKKEFLEYSSESINDILIKINEKSYPFETDGIIFTPSSSLLSKANSKASDPRDYNIKSFWNTGVTWDSLLKWKPPKDNTIDFYIQFGAVKNTIEDNKPFRYREISLHVFKVGSNGHYEMIQFSPPRYNDNAHIACVEIKTNDHIYCINGDVISNNSIVEFAFDKNNKGGFRWIPRNNRVDKTSNLKSAEFNKKRYGNKFSTANNVWLTYFYPVTENDIMNIGEKKDKTDEYYEEDSEKSNELQGMRTLHNEIKAYLIKHNGDQNNAKNILDTASGAGGDLSKYLEINNNKNKKLVIIGIEKSKQNIDIAYDRYQDLFKKNRIKNASVEYIQGDSTKSYKNAEASDMEEDKERYRTFFSAKATFDLITCHFAIHFFMETQKSWNGFLDNLEHVAKKGSYFTVTCLDGDRLHKIFGQEEKSIIKGFKDEDQKLLWSIERKYDQSDFELKNYGLRIETYTISVHSKRRDTEYLVKSKNLEDSLARIGFKLVDSGSFEKFKSNSDFFEKYKQKIQNINKNKLKFNKESIKKEDLDKIEKLAAGNEKEINESLYDLTKAETELSFLNKYFVFQKHE